MNSQALNQKMFDAVINNNQKALEVAFQEGADIHARNADNKEALEVAAEKGYLEVVELLLKKGAIDSYHDDNHDEDGYDYDNQKMVTNAIEIAQEKGHAKILKKIKRTLKYNTQLFNFLNDAIGEGTSDELEDDRYKEQYIINKCLRFFELGAYIDTKLFSCKTALMLFSGYDIPGKITLLQQMLNYGANINAKDKNQNSVLSCALYCVDDMKTVTFLIESGAIVDQISLQNGLTMQSIEQVQYLLMQKPPYHHKFAADKTILQHIFLKHLESSEVPSLLYRPHAIGELILQMARDDYDVASVKRDIKNITQLADISNINDVSVIKDSLSITSEYAKDLYRRKPVSTFTKDYLQKMLKYLLERLTASELANDSKLLDMAQYLDSALDSKDSILVKAVNEQHPSTETSVIVGNSHHDPKRMQV